MGTSWWVDPSGYILVGAPSADCLLPVKDYGNVPCLDLCPRSARNPSPQGDQKTSTLGNIMWHEIVYSGQLFLRCLLCTKRDGRVWKLMAGRGQYCHRAVSGNVGRGKMPPSVLCLSNLLQINHFSTNLSENCHTKLYPFIYKWMSSKTECDETQKVTDSETFSGTRNRTRPTPNFWYDKRGNC